MSDELAPPPPAYRLYTSGHVGAATFLGGPIGGGWLIARNFRTLGRPQAANITLGLCALGLLGLLAAVLGLDSYGEKLPATVQTSPALVVLVAMVMIANALQGDDVKAHQAAGGKLASSWYAVLAGIVGLAITVGGIVGVLIVVEGLPDDRPMVSFGDGHEVFYRDGATEDDARAVGKALTDHGVFHPGHDFSVEVSAARDRHLVGFVIQNWAVHERSTQDALHNEAIALSHDVWQGKPVDVAIVNAKLEQQVLLRWEERPFTIELGDGHHAIFQRGGSEAEARAAITVFNDEGIWTDARLIDFYVERDGVQPLVVFAVGQDAWTDRELVNRLARLAFPLSRKVFGSRPVELKIVDGEQHVHVSLDWNNRPPQ
jgi:hypothetical protein